MSSDDEDLFDYDKDSPGPSAKKYDEGDPEIPLSNKKIIFGVINILL